MKSKKNIIFLLTILFFYFFISVRIVSAESSYVLPYPSFMPGSKIYNLHVLYEKLAKYWYFGDIGRFDYDLKEADKYLVQAWVLFEYKQYLLADNALKISDDYFSNLEKDLGKIIRNHKNINEKKNLFRKAALKHVEVLLEMEKFLPAVFLWEPEKSLSSRLYLKEDINQAVKIRNRAL